MILVSKSANIVSKMTAFVAVDTEGQKQKEGEMVKRSCPVPVATKEFTEALHSSSLQSCGLFDGGGSVSIVNYNPYMTNGLAYLYHWDESTVSFRGFRRDFELLFHFYMKIL